jgi:hypothetical protein
VSLCDRVSLRMDAAISFSNHSAFFTHLAHFRKPPIDIALRQHRDFGNALLKRIASGAIIKQTVAQSIVCHIPVAQAFPLKIKLQKGFRIGLPQVSM